MNAKRTLFGVWQALVAVLVAALLVAVAAPAAIAQEPANESNEESADSSAASVPGGITGFAIPGYYPVSVLHSDPGSGMSGLDLDPQTGLLWVGGEDEDRLVAVDHGGVVQETIPIPGVDGFGLAVSDGLVFVTVGSNEVQVWTTDGSFVRTIGAGTVEDVCAVEVVGNNVYIGDQNAGGVWIYTVTGTFIDFFDDAGGTLLGLDCFFDFLASDGAELFVWDAINDQISVFDLGGNHQRDLSIVGDQGILDVDDNGDLWLADFDDSKVSKFDSNGVLIGDFDTSGSALGEIQNPEGFVVDPSGDSFWVQTGSEEVHVWTRLTCDGANLTQVGTSYSDRFGGGLGVDVVALGSGNDRYAAGGDADVVCGGSGADTIKGGPGDDVLIGQGGGDAIAGGGGADEIYGSSGDDVLDGQGGTDEIYGASGEDVIYGRGAADYIVGGTEDDIINGQNGADELHGAGGDDTMSGQTGPDMFFGEPGDDDMFGGDGADTFYGGSGFDRCAGNTGPDQAQGATCEQTPGIEVLF